MTGFGLPHLIVLLVGLTIFLAPTIIAFNRDHANKWLVLVVSFIPFVGWLGALIWAIAGKPTGKNVVDTFR